jgi:hypothetical protein
MEPARQGYDAVKDRAQHPRWARTTEEGPTDLTSWYTTRLHTGAVTAVQRTSQGKKLRSGAFGSVRKGVDLDSGHLLAVKKIVISEVKSVSMDLESYVWREVKILSGLSHVCSSHNVSLTF